MFSKQETFNIVWNGFVAQGFERAVDRDGYCVWQNQKGHKCTIGHLIEPELPEPNTEYLHLPYGTTYSDVHDTDLRSDMMDAHDKSSSPDEVKQAMINVAHKHGLEIPDVQ